MAPSSRRNKEVCQLTVIKLLDEQEQLRIKSQLSFCQLLPVLLANNQAIDVVSLANSLKVWLNIVKYKTAYVLFDCLDVDLEPCRQLCILEIGNFLEPADKLKLSDQCVDFLLPLHILNSFALVTECLVELDLTDLPEDSFLPVFGHVVVKNHALHLQTLILAQHKAFPEFYGFSTEHGLYSCELTKQEVQEFVEVRVN